MPAKSKAQFHKMGALYREGKISRTQLEDFNKGADFKDLPEHVSDGRKPPPRGRKKEK
jgi:hypothetical protein